MKRKVKAAIKRQLRREARRGPAVRIPYNRWALN